VKSSALNAGYRLLCAALFICSAMFGALVLGGAGLGVPKPAFWIAFALWGTLSITAAVGLMFSITKGSLAAAFLCCLTPAGLAFATVGILLSAAT
jgi:hypothetical protein